MNLDRNQIIGIVLLFGLFMAWTWINAPSEEELAERKRIQDSIAIAERLAEDPSIKKDIEPDTARIPPPAESQQPDSVAQATTKARMGALGQAASGEEETYLLENDLIRVTFSNKGGIVTDAMLKKYEKIVIDEDHNESKVPLHLLNDDKNIFEYLLPVNGPNNAPVRTGDLFFETRKSGNSITFSVTGDNGIGFAQTYTLPDDSYTVDYDLSFTGSDALVNAGGVRLNWTNYLDKIERNDQYERYYTTAYYKEVNEDPDYCSCRRDDTDELPETAIKWVSHANQFFNTTLLADERFGGGIFETEMLDEEGEDLKILRTDMEIPLEGRSSETFGMEFYLGPNEFERLYAFDQSIEHIIPFGRSIFGTINRWVIRPLFNFLQRFTGVKGIVILLLTLLVKVLLFPLMYKMLQSQAKMSALKPQLAGLKEKYKDDMQKQQMETMKVYREYGVSPLGGCLPMVAQLPIWFALYRFFPASIQFRQAEFLWATDLSSYDAFVYLPFEIPFYGAHVSLFTLLWAGTTVLYTFYNTRHMDMASMNPMMKYMQYFMPVMFLFFFNNYASGLTLYLFYSNIINIGMTLGTKRFLFDNEKILEELNKNKEKPKKKGGFQQRLEKAMKEQQRIAEEKAKQKKKKKN